MTYINYRIHNWRSIESLFKNSTLILGNGSSIAIHNQFAYSSLKREAELNGSFDVDVQNLFEEFKTDDFEFILRLVWHAAIINEKLSIPDSRTQAAYQQIREALITTVRKLHVQHQVINFNPLYNFTKKFRTIISLNYDLIMYWIMMYGLEIRDDHKFKDCFITNGQFDDHWNKFRDPYGYNNRETTLVFYPHGNLSLVRDIYDNESKIKTNYTDNLLEEVLLKWKSGNYIPLFISDGTYEKKRKSIKASNYLKTVYDEVLPTIFYESYKPNEYNLVIYGWGMGDQDEHILQQLLSQASRTEMFDKKIAISIYGNNQQDCHRFHNRISQIISSSSKIEIMFFNSKSSGCWNNP